MAASYPSSFLDLEPGLLVLVLPLPCGQQCAFCKWVLPQFSQARSEAFTFHTIFAASEAGWSAVMEQGIQGAGQIDPWDSGSLSRALLRLLPQERQMRRAPSWSPGAPLRVLACPPADICSDLSTSGRGGARSVPGSPPCLCTLVGVRFLTSGLGPSGVWLTAGFCLSLSAGTQLLWFPAGVLVYGAREGLVMPGVGVRAVWGSLWGGFSTLHSRLLSDQTQLKDDVDTLRRENGQLLRERNLLQQSWEDMKRLHEEDQKEIGDLRAQQQQVERAGCWVLGAGCWVQAQAQVAHPPQPPSHSSIHPPDNLASISGGFASCEALGYVSKHSGLALWTLQSPGGDTC